MAITAAANDPIFEATGTAEVNGATLAYRDVGAGEPVVFVHGGLSDLRTWQQQLPVIGLSYRAISYSRRYARPNADIEPGSDDQMQPHVDDLAAFLRAIDAAPAHLVGNSWGGFICLLTALRHPELVRSIVVEEPPVIPLVVGAGARPQAGAIARGLLRHRSATLATLRWGASSVAPLQKAFRRGDDEQALETFVHGVLGRQAYERLPQARKQQMRENLSALKAQMLGAGFPALTDADVRSIHARTLLLTGEHSPAFLLRLTEVLERLLPVVERVEIPAASHAMHEENAAAVNDAILAFLDHGSHSAGGAARRVAVA